MKPTILVLGGGIGGISTARELSRKIGNEDGINLARILVFEKEKSSLYAPSLTWMMVGKREEKQVYGDLSDVELGGIEVIHGEIQSIDPENRAVISNGTEYRGDYTVISLGTKLTDIYNLSRYGHNFYTPAGASSFYEDLQQFEGGEIAVVVSSLPHKSPVAPYEAALLIDDFIREKEIRQKTGITLYTPETGPMDFASEEISGKVRRLMEEKEIHYKPEHTLITAEKNSLTFSRPENKNVKAAFDLLAFTPKHTAPDLIREAGLTGTSGWVEVDEQTLQTTHDNVFAIGDIISLPVGDGKTLPKAGVFAQYQADTVAHNIARMLRGKQPNKMFEPKGSYILDQGDKASKVDGDFNAEELKIKTSSMIRHWEKVLTEKAWFLKNF
ncbi:NAD(P)/FAD-dependent oxidoreductase [Halalkalibaculum sp. DA3122]|uniref:NAD(P)/FAD-dependent oxidoreductase n=1 Tax=Halalkalibaculum sp. DA3122 TaxID=3373607 RepID=UPI0037553E7E